MFGFLCPSLPAARLSSAAVAVSEGITRSVQWLWPCSLAVQADSSGRGSARGGMWLPGRLVYCAGNKDAVVPELLKCLGVRPMPSAGGWSTLGSRPGGGTLLRNASSSVAFCLGLGSPHTHTHTHPPTVQLSDKGCVVPHCPTFATCTPRQEQGALLSPQNQPPYRLSCQLSSKARGWQASSPPFCGARAQVSNAGDMGIPDWLSPNEVAGSAMSSLQPFQCRLPEAVERSRLSITLQDGKKQPPQRLFGTECRH